MSRWACLSANEPSALEGVFWLHGPSREGASPRLAFSRTHVNAVIAGLPEQGWLDRAGRRESSGGRRAETLCMHPPGDQAGLIGAGVLALQEMLRGRGRAAAA